MVVKQEKRNQTKSKHYKNYSHVEKELSNAMKEIQRMKQLHEAKSSETHTRYSMLNVKYATERSEKSKLIQQIEESSNKYQQYEKQIEKYRSRASEFQKQVIESLKLENQISEYKMSNMRLQQQLNDLNNYKSQTITLKSENDKLQTIKFALENEITKQNGIICEFKNQLQKLFDENKQLSELNESNNEIETLTESIYELKTEKNSIKKAFEEYKQKSTVSHRTSIINEQIIIATLKQQIITLQSKLDTYEHEYNDIGVTITNENEYNDIEIMPSIEEQKEDENSDTIHTMSDDTNDKYEMNNDDDDDDDGIVTEILAKEKDTTVAQQRVLHTLEKSRTVTDVAKLVMEQYKTKDDEDEIIDNIDEENEESYEDESSLEEHEKLEIQRMKSQKKIQQNMDEEAEAMQKEMELMQQQMENSMKKEMIAIKSNLDVMREEMKYNNDDDAKDMPEYNDNDNDNGLESRLSGTVDDNDNSDSDNDNNNSDDTTRRVSISISEHDGDTPIDVDEMMKSPKNLFRYRSMVKWDQIELDKQKREMQAHMIHLVKHHTSKLKIGDMDSNNKLKVVDNVVDNGVDNVDAENKSDEQ